MTRTHEPRAHDNKRAGRGRGGNTSAIAQGARVRIERGKLKVIDGPFTEAKEVIGGFAILNAGSKDEAVAMAKQSMDLHIQHWPEWEGECDVRQMEEN